MKNGTFRGLLIFGFLSACGSSQPQINPTTQTSNDPILVGFLSSFQNSCIENAPSFSEDSVRAAFARNQPALAPGMSFISSGEPGRSCRVTVRNYGRDRPMPTVGDINSLGRSLHARVGGTFNPKSADTGAGSAQVRVGRTTYNVFAFVGNDGDLGLSVFK